MAKELVNKVKLQIPAGRATAAPPVGTALGPFGIPLPDNHTYQSFMKADIQDEFIIMKCCNCNNEEEVQADFVKAYLEHYPDQEYPEGICDKCKGRTIPLDIYNEENNK